MSFWFRRKRCSERLGLEEERGYAARPRALVWEPPSHGGGRMWGQGFGVLVCLAEVCADRRRGGRGEERRNRLRAEDFTQADEVRNLLRELKEAHEDKPFSDVVDDEGNQYVDLVMEGGGVRSRGRAGRLHLRPRRDGDKVLAGRGHLGWLDQRRVGSGVGRARRAQEREDRKGARQPGPVDLR